MQNPILSENEQFIIYLPYAECPVGMYGDDCRHVCQCNDVSACNKVTGECSAECPAGYMGEACEQCK